MIYPPASMSPTESTPPPVADVETFCLRLLRSGDLATKLSPALDAHGTPLVDVPSGHPIEIERPARDAGLRMDSGGDALPPPSALADAEARRLCLSRFAHHELQAVEYFAWALLRWPEAPTELRRGLLAALGDEQRHCRLYLDRLATLGGRFDTDDHSDYFWRQAPAIADSPAGMRAFLSAMGLTLEQANLDFTLIYRDAFAAAGDAESAAICQQVHDDEVAHVALAARWLGRLSASASEDASGARADTETCTLDDYLETVPFPLGPARAKGRHFAEKPRRRAGLPHDLIEYVREARVQERRTTPIPLLANLGAEEDGEAHASDAYASQGAVRTAAHLWSLLFARRARLHATTTTPDTSARPVSDLWPNRLGAQPSAPIFDFLDDDQGHPAFAWLNTPRAEAWAASIERELAGPPSDVVRTVHDKAFAARTAEALGLVPRSLERLVTVLEPMDCVDAEATCARLDATIADWPDWTRGRFTLKPRFGSSGRGRFGGAEALHPEKTRRALARMADRGGAIFEPWLERRRDLSVALHVAPSGERDTDGPGLRLLGSLELWCSSSGVYRGHCGEVDSRARVFSGDPEDESIRADAAAVAAEARAKGFHGPCGMDGFRYAEMDRDRLRPVVEFNARPTMGLVAIGLVRRALRLSRVRKRLGIQPGDRFGFALTYRRPEELSLWKSRIYQQLGKEALILSLAASSREGDPQASLVFHRNPEAIRAARAEAFGC